MNKQPVDVLAIVEHATRDWLPDVIHQLEIARIALARAEMQPADNEAQAFRDNLPYLTRLNALASRSGVKAGTNVMEWACAALDRTAGRIQYPGADARAVENCQKTIAEQDERIAALEAGLREIVAELEETPCGPADPFIVNALRIASGLIPSPVPAAPGS